MKQQALKYPGKLEKFGVFLECLFNHLIFRFTVVWICMLCVDLSLSLHSCAKYTNVCRESFPREESEPKLYRSLYVDREFYDTHKYIYFVHVMKRPSRDVQISSPQAAVSQGG